MYCRQILHYVVCTNCCTCFRLTPYNAKKSFKIFRIEVQTFFSLFLLTIISVTMIVCIKSITSNHTTYKAGQKHKKTMKLVSISSAFYTHIFHQYFGAKKISNPKHSFVIFGAKISAKKAHVKC